MGISTDIIYEHNLYIRIIIYIYLSVGDIPFNTFRQTKMIFQFGYITHKDV